MIEAQEKASNAMARFVLSVGFSEQDGVKHATSVDFQHSVKRSDGTEEIETITMPLITVIPVPNMQIIDGKISLDVEISSVLLNSKKTLRPVENWRGKWAGGRSRYR